jgi:hypothetical protein
VRGPFDIADRRTYFSAPSPIFDSIPRPSSANSHTRTFSKGLHMDYIKSPKNIDNNQINNILGKRSGILLNKEREDLCWDCLFMVCGGTGITPMLQLVSSINFDLILKFKIFI